MVDPNEGLFAGEVRRRRRIEGRGKRA